MKQIGVTCTYYVDGLLMSMPTKFVVDIPNEYRKSVTDLESLQEFVKETQGMDIEDYLKIRLIEEHLDVPPTSDVSAELISCNTLN